MSDITRGSLPRPAVLLPALSGILMAAPHLLPELVPLQMVGLLPLLFALATRSASFRFSAGAGIVMGLTYTLPQVIPTKMPIWVAVMLVAYLTLIWTIYAVLGRILLRNRTLLGALAAGCLLPVMDWINFTVIPVWGTAQSFVRPWSTSPSLVAFVAFTGITGIALILGCVQALIVLLVLSRERRGRALAALASVLVLVAAGDSIPLLKGAEGSLTVAAVGYTRENLKAHGGVESPEGFEALIREPVSLAASQGAKLVVTPELAFSSEGSPDDEEWFGWAASLAREKGILLVVGYFHEADGRNRLLFIDREGAVVGEYTKVFLTPYESYGCGDGTPVTLRLGENLIGGMICQDDNFTRLSRMYGRMGVALVAVPTYDWPTVRDPHFQNSRFRTMESGYGIVRAARDGISAAVSARGEILALMDHVEEGPGFIVAELPLYPPGTLFNKLGHWPVMLGFLFILAALGQLLWASKKKSVKT